MTNSVDRYDLDRIVCGQDPAKTLVPILDEIAAVGAKVMLDLRAEVEVVMQNNRTSDWEYFHGIVDAVRSHAAVLAIYYTLRSLIRFATLCCPVDIASLN